MSVIKQAKSLKINVRSIHYVSDYFNAMYEPEWLTNDFARRAIREVDESEYFEGDCIKDYLGVGMSARGLSTRFKFRRSVIRIRAELSALKGFMARR